MVKRKIFPLFFIQFFVAGAGWTIVGPLVPVLADDFEVSLGIVGLALSLSSFGVLLATIFSGIISEKLGKKNTITLGCTLFVISFLGIYLSNNFVYFTLSYIIFGISWGIISVTSYSVISDIYQLNKSKILIRLAMGNSFGSLFGPLLVSGILFTSISWRYLFIFIMLMNIILLILMLLLRIEGFDNKKSGENLIGLFTANRKLLSNLIIILCGVIVFFHFGLGYTFLAWFTTYFKEIGVPVAYSSLILSLFVLSFSTGMFFKSFLLARFSEKKVIRFSLILSFILLFGSFVVDWLVFKIILIILFGFSYSAITEISISIGIKQNTRYSGFATSIIQSFGWTGVVILQYFTGYLTENFSGKSVYYIGLTALFLLIVLTSVLVFSNKSDKEFN